MAGLKDRQGVTIQFMSIRRGREVNLRALDLTVETAGFSREGLSSGHSLGNAFLEKVLRQQFAHAKVVETLFDPHLRVGRNLASCLRTRLKSLGNGALTVRICCTSATQGKEILAECRLRRSINGDSMRPGFLR